MDDNELNELRKMVRLAAIVGRAMASDDGPTVANAAERIADAVVARVTQGRAVHPEFGKAGQMQVSVVDGQRVEAPAAAPGGAAPTVSAQQLVNALGALLAAQAPGVQQAPAASPAGGPTEVGVPGGVVQTPAR